METTNAVTILKKEFYEPVKTDWLAQSGLKEGDFMREVSFAIQHLHKSPYLQKATPQSLLKAVINLAQVGLTLNPISKFAALVPRWNRDLNCVEAVLEPMYQGLAKLLTDSGAVKDIKCYAVFTGDAFKFDYSLPNPIVSHVPAFLLGPPQEPGTIKAAYSRATLPDGSFHVEIMSYKDICEIRDRSESYKAFKDGKTKSCIWVTDEPEMCRKTVIKRHYKYLPKSTALEQFERAVDLDNRANGFDEQVDFNTMTFIESLIHSATISEKEKEKFNKEMINLGWKSQAFKLIDKLKDCQPIMGLHSTPIDQGKDLQAAIRYQADKDDWNETRKQ